MSFIIRLFKRPFIYILLIVLLSLTAYSNTFTSSFQFDDDIFIVENPTIKDLGNFIGTPGQLKNSRYISFLTFALNYRVHGLDVTGYHVVNLLIHIINALLIYLLVMLTFRTPFLNGSPLREQSRYMALLASLLFAVHPIQTQAVTYIWQRMASLATMFFLISLVTYIQFRLQTGVRASHKLCNPCKAETTGQAGIRVQEKGTKAQKQQTTENGYGKLEAHGSWLKAIPLYLISLISAVLAMKTKQIAFTLPLVIAMYEFFFFSGRMKKRLLFLIPLLLTMLIIPLGLISVDQPLGEIIGDVSEKTRVQTGMSRLDYLFTEFRVIATYIRLIFLPINQNLDYDYPVYTSFSDPNVFLSFILLSSILLAGIYIFRRRRDSKSHTRLISFGIFWFFITLSVESSVIPIVDVIFEHRMYLPSVGVSIALTTAIFMVMQRWKGAVSYMTGALVIIIITLTGATYARNEVWKEQLSMYRDIVAKSPNNPRAHYGLGNAYMDNKSFDKAIEHYRTAIRLKPDYYKAFGNLGFTYYLKGLIDPAIIYYQMTIRIKPDFPEVYRNIGFAYFLKGNIDKAIEHLEFGARLAPNDAMVHLNLGIAYKSKGLTDKANRHFHLARSLNPDYFNEKNLHR